MMTDAEKGLISELELLYDKWLHEWSGRVRTNTQPTRMDEQRHLVELKKLITDRVGVDDTNMEGYLK